MGGWGHITLGDSLGSRNQNEPSGATRPHSAIGCHPLAGKSLCCSKSMQSRAVAPHPGKARPRIVVLLQLLVLAPILLAASLAKADPIDRYVQQEMELNSLPGVVIVLVRANGPADVRAYGVADTSSGQPLTARTLVELASVSKTFTGLAVLRLVQAGQIDPQAPIATYLAPFRQAADPLWQTVRVRDLLRHRSGLRREHDYKVPCCGKPGDGDLQFAAQQLARVRLASRPGTTFHYANSNYVLLAALVEQVTGVPFPQYMGEQVFQPLGMTDTTAGEAPATAAIARFHEWRWGSVRPSPSTFLGWYGSSRIKSNGVDMARYLAALLGPRLLGVDNWWRQLEGNYDYGWQVDRAARWLGGELVLYHGGNLWGVNTAVVLAPRWRAGVAVLIPMGTDRALPIARALMQSLLGLPLPVPQRMPWAENPDHWAMALLAVALGFYVTSARYVVALCRTRKQGGPSQARALQWIRAGALLFGAAYIPYALYGGSIPPLDALPSTIRVALPQLAWSATTLLVASALHGLLTSSRGALPGR